MSASVTISFAGTIHAKISVPRHKNILFRSVSHTQVVGQKLVAVLTRDNFFTLILNQQLKKFQDKSSKDQF